MLIQNAVKKCPIYQCTSGQVWVSERVPCNACTFTQRSFCCTCGGTRYVNRQKWATCQRCYGNGYIRC